MTDPLLLSAGGNERTNWGGKDSGCWWNYEDFFLNILTLTFKPLVGFGEEYAAETPVCVSASSFRQKGFIKCYDFPDLNNAFE